MIEATESIAAPEMAVGKRQGVDRQAKPTFVGARFVDHRGRVRHRLFGIGVEVIVGGDRGEQRAVGIDPPVVGEFLGIGAIEMDGGIEIAAQAPRHPDQEPKILRVGLHENGRAMVQHDEASSAGRSITGAGLRISPGSSAAARQASATRGPDRPSP